MALDALPVTLFDLLDAERKEQVDPYPRPRVRAECEKGGWNEGRPCPYVGCRYHLCVDVVGSRVLEARPLDDGLATCALDLAVKGGMTLEEIGPFVGDLTRERIRQIEAKAINRVRTRPERRRQLIEFCDERLLSGASSVPVKRRRREENNEDGLDPRSTGGAKRHR